MWPDLKTVVAAAAASLTHIDATGSTSLGIHKLSIPCRYGVHKCFDPPLFFKKKEGGQCKFLLLEVGNKEESHLEKPIPLDEGCRRKNVCSQAQQL